MMFEHLGLDVAGKAIHEAVATVLAGKEPKTPDLGGTSTTEQVGRTVSDRLG